jgi:hypothetical protein
MTKLNLLAAPLILASILFVACIAPAQTPTQTNAQQQAASSTVPVTTVVTVLGPSYTAPPALGKEDVVVHTGSRREDVTAWTPAQGQRAPLQLAILIDDGAGINSQLPDLRHFIQTQSNSTSVGLFYASMGTTQTVAPFSTDHDAVAKKLRITEGRTGVSTSIYLSTIDVMKKLAPMSGRREILLIGDGRDRLRGDLDSPDVQRVIDTAQKTGIVIHTLYASVGRGGFNSIRLGYAQSNLTRVAGETGGKRPSHSRRSWINWTWCSTISTSSRSRPPAATRRRASSAASRWQPSSATLPSQPRVKSSSPVLNAVRFTRVCRGGFQTRFLRPDPHRDPPCHFESGPEPFNPPIL